MIFLFFLVIKKNSIFDQMTYLKKTSLLTFTILLAFVANTKAQVVSPKHGDTLNYTQVMFEYKEIFGADYYNISIYNHAHNSKIAYFKTQSLAKIIDGILEFGETYSWSYEAFSRNGLLLFQSSPSSFHILKTRWNNPNLIEMKVSVFDKKKMDRGLIIFDFGVIINKQGKIIWNLPQTDGTFRNLVINKDGALTYNNRKGSFETDLAGNITWGAPTLLADTIKVKNYHHDIKKLPNGNFLCLAERDINEGNKIYNAVFEIDRNYNLKWYWDESPFYKDRTDSITSNHVNAVFMDESTKDVYLSNRNLNSLTRLSGIPKPIISMHIGKGYEQNNIQMIPQTLFSGQHAVSITPKNTILLFNNNTAHPEGVSSVIELKIPDPKDKEPIVLWSYPFQFAKHEENFCAKSGDADVLPNGNILITSGANNRVFEVTKNKKIVWENIAFRRDSITDAFTPQSSYRSHFCSSLYPTYFTVQQFSHLVSKGRKITLKINNDGSEPDSYFINQLMSDGTYKEIGRLFLNAGKQKKVSFKISEQNTTNCTIKISSSNNALKNKQLIYSFK
ncbi:MAG: hypothetical protein EAY81_04595 [Bacteroidetes bacterium]|nr:MAG: hypothetical protein EAY81_04595 [Bacteroidota bacterium]